MAFCINCGHQLPDGAKFCAECGSPVQTSAQSQRKTVYEGEIHKCPNCGEVLKSFSPVCSACGFEIRGAQNTSIVKKFALQLQSLQSKKASEKPINFLSKLYGKKSRIEEEKIDLIKNFVIPNTKEDVLEFVILAASNIDINCFGLSGTQYPHILGKELSEAWLAKLEQAYQKALLMFSTSDEFQVVNQLYQTKKNEIAQKRKREIAFWVSVGGGIALFIGGLVALVLALTL